MIEGRKDYELIARINRIEHTGVGDSGRQAPMVGGDVLDPLTYRLKRVSYVHPMAGIYPENRWDELEEIK